MVLRSDEKIQVYSLVCGENTTLQTNHPHGETQWWQLHAAGKYFFRNSGEAGCWTEEKQVELQAECENNSELCQI